MSNFSPSYDNKIARKYSLKTLDQKVQNKVALQEELGWPKEQNIPVMCIPASITEQSGGEMLEKVLPGIMSQQIQLLVIGKGSSSYGELFTKLAKDKNHRVAIVKDSEEDRRKMYAAADMALFVGDTSEVEALQHCLNYGVVPIAKGCDLLEDYNPVQESGNAFLYEGDTEWHCFAPIVRALETHKFPFDWRTIQRNCMEKAKEE